MMSSSASPEMQESSSSSSSSSSPNTTADSNRRRSSSSSSTGFRKAFGAVARRVSLPRRDSGGDGSSSKSNKLPTIKDVTNTTRSPSPPPSDRSADRTSRTSSISSYAPPLMLLNSSSPASELPQTWVEWNKAYQMGLIDYNDPPPPPSNLWTAVENASPTGQYRAPLPFEEGARQRAVDNLGLINHRPYQRRPSSGISPKTSSGKTERNHASAEDKKVGNEIVVADDDENVEDGEPLESVPPGKHTNHGDVGLVPPYPKELATHPALLKLAQTAKKRFGTDGGTVSLMDQGSQVFLAEEGFNAQELPRQSTICSHTMLKATATKSKDSLVVLDIANDWRFASNDFGQFAKGFYAAAPIMLPAALGDTEEMRPAGIFCVIDPKPRVSFSEDDRHDLELMADEAADEIMKAAREKAEFQGAALKTKREAWKRSKLVRRVSEKTRLESVEELTTPPTSPEVVQLEDSGHALTVASLAAVANDVFEASSNSHDESSKEVAADVEITACSSDGTPTILASKRPSLAESVSDVGSAELGITDVTPTFGRRRGRKGVHASTQRIAPEIKSVLELSTQLIGESLDLEFTYVVAIDLPTSSASSPRTVGEKPMRLLSSHNLPIPAPLFDVDLHLETLTSHQHALLYTDPDFSGAEGEFSSGLLLKILTTDHVGYVLGAFTENPRRVLNKQDYHFMKSFAGDLARQVAKV